jgi:hypothetical protein
MLSNRSLYESRILSTRLPARRLHHVCNGNIFHVCHYKIHKVVFQFYLFSKQKQQKFKIFPRCLHHFCNKKAICAIDIAGTVMRFASSESTSQNLSNVAFKYRRTGQTAKVVIYSILARRIHHFPVKNC